MAKEIKTEIRIAASAEKVWKVLMDFKSYGKWNPFIRSITGEASLGCKLEVVIIPPGKKGMTFRPEVLEVKEKEEFRWKGKLFIPGLFDGEHCFKLNDHGDGSCTLSHSEKFTGLLVPLFKKMLDVNTLNGFRLMNQKLKEAAETPG